MSIDFTDLSKVAEKPERKKLSDSARRKPAARKTAARKADGRPARKSAPKVRMSDAARTLRKVRMSDSYKSIRRRIRDEFEGEMDTEEVLKIVTEHLTSGEDKVEVGIAAVEILATALDVLEDEVIVASSKDVAEDIVAEEIIEGDE